MPNQQADSRCRMSIAVDIKFRLRLQRHIDREAKKGNAVDMSRFMMEAAIKELDRLKAR